MTCLTIYQSFHCYSDAHSSSIKSQESVTIRNFSRQNVNAFNNLLCETDWNSLTSKDADVACDEFLQKYSELYNKSFLPRLCQGKKLKTLCNPWLSKGLTKYIITKSRLHKLFLKRPIREHEVRYKAHKNKLTTLIRVIRYVSEITESINFFVNNQSWPL